MGPAERSALARSLGIGEHHKIMVIGGGSDVPPILPGAPARFSGCPIRAEDALCLERIVIGSASPFDWIVNDILIGGESQLKQKDLPGSLFSAHGIGTRGGILLMFSGLDIVEPGKDLTLVVTYVGPNPEGGRFFASAIGIPPHPVVRSALRAVSVRIQEAATIVVRPSVTFKVQALRIERNPSDWMISDVRINDLSQFSDGIRKRIGIVEWLGQPGAIPGDVFAEDADGAEVMFDTCLAGDPIALDVMYIGVSTAGECLEMRLEGLVVSLDPEQPWRGSLRATAPNAGGPVRAQVETIFKGTL